MKKIIDFIKKLLGIDGKVDPVVVEQEETLEEKVDRMSKLDLDKFAEKEFGIKLDRRKRKDDMVEDFFNALNK